MDTTNSVSSVRRRTPTKRSKSKKKSIKVVYIPNPMKVSTSASEFRALVQELTGQDAELPPDPSRFRDPGSDDSGGDGGHQTDYSISKNGVTKNDDDENDHNTFGMMMPQVEADHICEGQVGSTMEWFEPFDDVDVFPTQIMDNISAFYESAQVDQVLRSLHAV